jgi:hypothetical protein
MDGGLVVLYPLPPVAVQDVIAPPLTVTLAVPPDPAAEWYPRVLMF